MGRDNRVPSGSGYSAMINRRILVITGAGISAESGIPTFRGKDGYWRNFDPAKLATPEAFEQDPDLIWEWYRERRTKIRQAQPNQAHEAISRLADQCSDFLLVTQNVDNLHARAEYKNQRISADKIVQIHGDIFLTRCSRCEHEFREVENDSGSLPLCRECGSMMRPGVVWFGETLDPEKIAKVEAFLAKRQCEFVLVIGTTAMFGYIIDWALRAAENGGHLIEINPDETALSRFAAKSVRKPAGTVLPELVEELLRSN
jgi:NAD-dependent deacetylase